MKKYIRKILQKYLDKPFVKNAYNNNSDVYKLPNGYYNSFGQKNADKIFYVVWLNGGSGFFSNLSSVLCHLKIADQFGMIPVIDFFNFKTHYNIDTKINNSANAWEYYFRPVSDFDLSEVYQSKNVFFCTGSYPHSMSYNVTSVDGLIEIYNKYIFPLPYINKIVDEYLMKLKFNCRIVGVHFRGQEQKIAPYHSFPPTKDQMLNYCDTIIEKYRIDKIFIVTEEQDYLDLFIKRYGEKVVYTDSFRTKSINAYNMSPRENHRYHLGLEVLIDALLLSKCTGILCSDSNVSEIACFVNNNKFEFEYKVDNGVNSSNRLLARYLFNLKKRFPSRFGGLKNKVIIKEVSK